MVTDAEVETVIAFLKAQNAGEYDAETADAIIATPLPGSAARHRMRTNSCLRRWTSLSKPGMRLYPSSSVA
jgi:hypothetical protein